MLFSTAMSVLQGWLHTQMGILQSIPREWDFTCGPWYCFFSHLNFCTCWETTSKAYPAGWVPGRYLLISRQMCHMLIACCATCPPPAELLTSVRGCLRPTHVCSHPVVRAYTTMWEKLTLVQEGKASAEADWEGSRGTSPEICARLCRRPIAQRDATFPMSG